MRRGFSPHHFKIVPIFQSASLNRKVENRSAAPRITLRLSEGEHARLIEAAAGKTVSAYVRQCLFGKDVAPRKTYRPPASKDHEALAELLGLLGQTRMSSNLNQIAHHANRGTLEMDEVTESEIRAACAQIAWIRVKLIEALGLKAREDSDDP